MSGPLPVIVTSDVDAASRPCLRRLTTFDNNDQLTRPTAPAGILGECDEPPRRLQKGRMKHMIHQAVVDGRTASVRVGYRSIGYYIMLLITHRLVKLHGAASFDDRANLLFKFLQQHKTFPIVLQMFCFYSRLSFFRRNNRTMTNVSGCS